MVKNYTENRIEQQIRFLEALQALNPQQRRAVHHTEGPMLAIAGPGTGKTHILTARIGQILLQTDAQPHNILCLTFTDAGVHSMQERLLSFIGPEAHRVHIYTFHSFCNKIIQENLDIFGQHDLEPLSDLEGLEIMRDLLDSLDLEHPLRAQRKDVHYYEGHLQDLFRRMKSEAWSVDYIDACIDEYMADLPNQKDFVYQRNSGKFKKGELKIARLAEVKKRMERLRAAIFLFEKYTFILRQRSRYDYEDMMLWVLKAFQKEEFLLRNYQEQYLYILVDEFQDTNGLQNQIVQQLIAYWENRPNIFIVGDDDQSIYEFQGARVKNMLDFYKKYERSIEVVLLTYNYRSTQKILDAAQILIQKNTLRVSKQLDHLGIHKKLLAADPTVKNLKHNIKVIAYRNRIQEEIGIVERIEYLNTKEGIPLDEMAIIYARHKQAQQIIQILEKKEIPYRSKRKVNILELPLIQNFLQVLRYIAKEYEKAYSGEFLFFELLHYNFIQMEAYDINQLSAFMARGEAQKKYAERTDNEDIYWKDLIQSESLLDTLRLKNKMAVLELSNFLEDSILAYKNKTLPRLLEFIINRSGLLYYAAKQERKDWHIQVIHTLFEFSKQESLKNPSLNLSEFLNILQRMEDNKIALGVYKTSYTYEGINLITAHSSKGLEFRYVFIINCLKDFWESSNKNRSRRFVFPPTLTHTEAGNVLEASRRLFYVAMTRAKEQLQFSYYEFNEADKRQERTRFLDEILAETTVAIEKKWVDNRTLTNYQFLSLSSTTTQNLPILNQEILTKLLERFKLSISAMNTYLSCPLSFYYEYVLCLPSLPSREASYSTAIHNALNRLFNSVKEYGRLPPVSKLQAFFQQEMKKQRVFFKKSSYQDNLNLGMRHLPIYYAQRKERWNEQLEQAEILTEKQFKQVELDGVPITGTIDKLVFYSNQKTKEIHLVDYKLGTLKEKRLRPPTPAHPEGGNYWRQLIFYKLLLEHARITPYSVQNATIDYLTPNEQDEFPLKPIKISAKDTDIVRRLIKETYQKIKNFEFETGCGRPSCKWCNFVKRNQMPDSFNNEEAEQMDD